jgi:nitroreductase
MSGEMISEEQLNTIFEAARWAPSTYNEQEWRFLYAWRDTPEFEQFFGLLVSANQTWCKSAAVLIVTLSHKVFERNSKPNPVHSLDTGMAVQNLLLQASDMGLVGHGMAGYDAERARNELKIPVDFQIECMIALGQPGSLNDLSPEQQKMERPSDRNPITSFAFEGAFPS